MFKKITATLLACLIAATPAMAHDNGINVQFTQGGVSDALVYPNIGFNFGDKAPTPKLQPHNFNASFYGHFEPKITGVYAFVLESDFASRLTIGGDPAVGGTTVVDNFSIPKVKGQGQIKLTAGVSYPIEVLYVTKSAPAYLRLRYIQPLMPVDPSTLFTSKQ